LLASCTDRANIDMEVRFIPMTTFGSTRLLVINRSQDGRERRTARRESPMSIGRGYCFNFCRLSMRAAPAALIIFALLFPAHAQFWGDPWGGRQQQRQYSPFGGYWGDRSGGFWGDRRWEGPRYPRHRERQPEQTQDYSRAPPATPRKDATTKIVVIGDANADWLAYGLEDAFSEQAEIGIVRKHRTDSGLIRYDARRDTDWPQVAREIIAAEKPKFIVMMFGKQ
jgi:hypothetical protein